MNEDKIQSSAEEEKAADSAAVAETVTDSNSNEDAKAEKQNEKPEKKGTLLKYLIFSFGIAWVLQAAAIFCASIGQTLIYTIILTISMFAPMAAVLLSGAGLKGMGFKPKLDKKHTPWFIFAWLSPMAFTILGAVVYYAILPSMLDMNGGYINAMSGVDIIEALKQQGMDYKLYIVIEAVSAISYGAFVNMVVGSIGEESGWRGYLYPELKKRLGRIGGLILGGVIWGLWHFPITFFAGYNYGTTYFGAPYLSMPVFCVFTVFFGILLDFIYERSGSIWAPALAHGAFNAAAGLPIMMLAAGGDVHMLLGPSPIGLVAGIPLIVAAAAVLIFSRNSVPPETD